MRQEKRVLLWVGLLLVSGLMVVVGADTLHNWLTLDREHNVRSLMCHWLAVVTGICLVTALPAALLVGLGYWWGGYIWLCAPAAWTVGAVLMNVRWKWGWLHITLVAVCMAFLASLTMILIRLAIHPDGRDRQWRAWPRLVTAFVGYVLLYLILWSVFGPRLWAVTTPQRGRAGEFRGHL